MYQAKFKLCWLRMSLRELQSLNKKEFKKIFEKMYQNKIFLIFTAKKRTKGNRNELFSFKDCEYFLPNDELSISEQVHIFSIRNRMVKIETNFRGTKNKITCFCDEFDHPMVKC